MEHNKTAEGKVYASKNSYAFNSKLERPPCFDCGGVFCAFQCEHSALMNSCTLAACCTVCAAPAEIRCRTCFRSGVFYCSSCSSQQHPGMRGGHDHVLDALHEDTRGFRAVKPTGRLLRPAHCASCMAAFKVDRDYIAESATQITLLTRDSGPVVATVSPLTCRVCTTTSGAAAPEFFCIAGGATVWVEQALLEERQHIYDASGFSVSVSSMAAAYEKRSLSRGWNGACARSVRVSTERAARVFGAISDSYDQGGHSGKLAADLSTCPACSGAGCKGVHGDACFGLFERQNSGTAQGVPLTPSVLGTCLRVDEKSDMIVDDDQERFRAWRVEILKKVGNRSAAAKEAPSSCPPLRSMADQKAASKNHKIKAVHFCVCRHNVAATNVGLGIPTPGEGAAAFNSSPSCMFVPPT
jgi:hypothetical protein